MDYGTRRKLSFIILAVSSSQFWYYPLVDGLSDTAFASLGFSIAQILAIVLPFLGCLIWEKERSYNRATFVMTYFFVLGICDYAHSFIYNLIWDVYSAWDISVSIVTVQYILICFMMFVRIVLSLRLYKWSFRHMMIVIKFK